MIIITVFCSLISLILLFDIQFHIVLVVAILCYGCWCLLGLPCTVWYAVPVQSLSLYVYRYLYMCVTWLEGVGGVNDQVWAATGFILGWIIVNLNYLSQWIKSKLGTCNGSQVSQLHGPPSPRTLPDGWPRLVNCTHSKRGIAHNHEGCKSAADTTAKKQCMC